MQFDIIGVELSRSFEKYHCDFCWALAGIRTWRKNAKDYLISEEWWNGALTCIGR